MIGKLLLAERNVTQVLVKGKVARASMAREQLETPRLRKPMLDLVYERAADRTPQATAPKILSVGGYSSPDRGPPRFDKQAVEVGEWPQRLLGWRFRWSSVLVNIGKVTKMPPLDTLAD